MTWIVDIDDPDPAHTIRCELHDRGYDDGPNEVYLAWVEHQLDLDQAEADAEMQAEFAMSWVCGGGRSEDISAAWALHRHTWT